MAVADSGVDGGVAVLETERKLICGLPCILFNIKISPEDDACMKKTATTSQNYGIPLHTRYKFQRRPYLVLHRDHAPVDEKAPDGVEVPLLAGVVQGKEGLLVRRVGVGASPQEQLRHAEEAAAGGLVKDSLVVLRNRCKRRK